MLRSAQDSEAFRSKPQGTLGLVALRGLVWVLLSFGLARGLIGCTQCARTAQEHAMVPALGTAVEPHNGLHNHASEQVTQPALLPKAEGALRLGIFGDMGLGSEPERNLDLLVSLHVDLVLVLGDFDYQNSPSAWAELMARLGDTPWIAVVGNHDLGSFVGYERVISSEQQKHASRTGCAGTPGRRTSCGLGPVRIVLSEIGTMGDVRQNEEFLERELGAAKEPFRICAWHKNQADLQVGHKRDEVGYKPYQICQKFGALVVSGHEHSYSRTRVLTQVGFREKDHGVIGLFDELRLGPGRTAVIVTGLGGTGIRGYSSLFHDDDRWWAAYVTSDRRMRSGKSESYRLVQGYSGSLVLDLGLERRANVGRGYFVLAQSRQVMDQFELMTTLP